MINKFTKEFTTDFCDETGAIDWNKIVKLNSSIDDFKINKPKTKPSNSQP